MSEHRSRPEATTAIALLTPVKIILFTKIQKKFHSVKKISGSGEYSRWCKHRNGCTPAYIMPVFGHSSTDTKP